MTEFLFISFCFLPWFGTGPRVDQLRRLFSCDELWSTLSTSDLVRIWIIVSEFENWRRCLPPVHPHRSRDLHGSSAQEVQHRDTNTLDDHQHPIPTGNILKSLPFKHLLFQPLQTLSLHVNFAIACFQIEPPKPRRGNLLDGTFYLDTGFLRCAPDERQ